MKKQRLFFLIIILVTFYNYNGAVDEGPLGDYGYLVEFKLLDNLGNERNIQVFVPHNYNHEVPAKVIWYFRGTNGIMITWDIETTRLYIIGYEEKAIVVAPDLYLRTWSKGSDETDFYLVKDIIEKLKTVKDNSGRTLNLDLENMLATGFSAGGGLIFRLAGRYPLIFNEIVFRKYIDHAKSLAVTIDEYGNLKGNQYDVQALNDLKAAYTIFPDEKPPFFISRGEAEGSDMLELMKNTRDVIEKIGFETYFYTVPNLRHRFNVVYTPEFKKKIKDFLFPIHITKPAADSVWDYKPAKEFEIKWVSELEREKSINIDLFSLNENRYLEIARHIPDSGSYNATLDYLSIKTGQYFVRITTDYNMDIAYSGSFKISAVPLTLILQAFLKEEKAWVIKRYYGEINLSVAYMMTDVPVARFMIYRKVSGEEYQLIKEIPAEDLINGSFSFSDKYLKISETYTYKAEALDINGTVLAASKETLLLPGWKTSQNSLYIPKLVNHKGETR